MYNLILFDIDGVLLSEERYFDASALTVYELLTGDAYMGLGIEGAPAHARWFETAPGTRLSDDIITGIRQFVFHHDEILDFMKRRGINANWDMVYLQFAHQLIRLLASREIALTEVLGEDVVQSGQIGPEHLRRLGEVLRQHGADSFVWTDFADIYRESENRQALFNAVGAHFHERAGVPLSALPAFTRGLWNLGQQAFQDWYLGEEYRETATAKGKSGFLDAEVPLVDGDALTEVLEALKNRSAKLGIATGRPETETYVPLRLLGWLDRFEAHRITTASDVLRAQAGLSDAPPLSKPHPFSYLRSYLGSPDDATVVSHPLPLQEEAARKLLVVGDSVADWMAAKAIGCDFAAVLTGLSGASAREQFESLGCTYIWDNVLDVASLLQ